MVSRCRRFPCRKSGIRRRHHGARRSGVDQKRQGMAHRTPAARPGLQRAARSARVDRPVRSGAGAPVGAFVRQAVAGRGFVADPCPETALKPTPTAKGFTPAGSMEPGSCGSPRSGRSWTAPAGSCAPHGSRAPTSRRRRLWRRPAPSSRWTRLGRGRPRPRPEPRARTPHRTTLCGKLSGCSRTRKRDRSRGSGAQTRTRMPCR